jgi:hypothetical protein
LAPLWSARSAAPCGCLCSGGFGQRRLGLLPGVERHRADGRPVARVATPAPGAVCLGLAVKRRAPGRDGALLAAVPLLGGEEADRAVAVLAVLPGDKPLHPLPRRLQALDAFHRIIWAVFAGAKDRLGERVVVAHPRAAIRRRASLPICCGATPVHGNQVEIRARRFLVVAGCASRRCCNKRIPHNL